MQFSKCPVCKAKPHEPINLKCDHHPCFACAKSIMTIDQESTLQTKYRITCPTCSKKTLTYDIRHLIISFTQQDEDLYCTTKYISKKPEVIIKKSNNYMESQRASLCSQRNSLTSSTNKIVNTAINIECKRHPTYLLQYFCDTCFRSDSEDAFMCEECINTHKHKVRNIRQAHKSLHDLNEDKIINTLPLYKNELNKLLKQLGNNKENIKAQYEKLQKQITEEFKSVYLSINKQYQNLKKDMKDFYLKQVDGIKNSISLATRLNDSLSGLQKMYRLDNTEIQSMISFHNYFYQIGKAIDTNKRTLSRALQKPIIIKKAITTFHEDPLITIKFQNQHSRKSSKVSSPIYSPRVQDYNSQGQKSKKMKFTNTNKASKQNMISPRQKFSFESLLFHS